MNFQKWISALAVVCFLAAVVFLIQTRQPRQDTTQASKPALPNQEKASPLPQKPAQLEQPEQKPASDPRLTRLADGRVLYNPAIAASSALYQDSAERDLEIVGEALTFYRQIFRENPPGSENGEIIEQLLGANPQNLVFLSEENCQLSPKGELLDRWDSPFIFHPLTATAMEILSKGPDQSLWTEDDLALKLKELRDNLQL